MKPMTQDNHLNHEHLPDKSRNSKRSGLIIRVLVYGSIIVLIWSGLAPGRIHHDNKKRNPARTTIANLNEGQKLYYAKKNIFANDIPSLGVSISSNNNYNYSTKFDVSGVIDKKNIAFSYANSKHAVLRSYVGAVFRVQSQKSEVVSIICESYLAGVIQIPKPFLKNGEATCAPGTMQVSN